MCSLAYNQPGWLVLRSLLWGHIYFIYWILTLHPNQKYYSGFDIVSWLLNKCLMSTGSSVLCFKVGSRGSDQVSCEGVAHWIGNCCTESRGNQYWHACFMLWQWSFWVPDTWVMVFIFYLFPSYICLVIIFFFWNYSWCIEGTLTYGYP